MRVTTHPIPDKLNKQTVTDSCPFCSLAPAAHLTALDVACGLLGMHPHCGAEHCSILYLLSTRQECGNLMKLRQAYPAQ